MKIHRNLAFLFMGSSNYYLIGNSKANISVKNLDENAITFHAVIFEVLFEQNGIVE